MASQSQPLSTADLRRAEHITMLHTPETVLMDRAASAVAGESQGAARVALLVGRGNNGGDALLAGSLLAARGTAVTAVLLSHDAHGRGLSELRAAGGAIIDWAVDSRASIAAIEDADTVIDGIVGIGGTTGLRAPADAAVDAVVPGTRVIAVDIPSGLDPDSGDASRAHVRADVTVTFTAPKACLVTEPASASAGRVVIADVGVSLPSMLE